MQAGDRDTAEGFLGTDSALFIYLFVWNDTMKWPCNYWIRFKSQERPQFLNILLSTNVRCRESIKVFWLAILASFTKGSQISYCPTQHSQCYWQMYKPHERLHGAKEHCTGICCTYCSSLWPVPFHLVFIIITQLSSVESGSRFAEGPVLLGSTKLLCIIEEAFEPRDPLGWKWDLGNKKPYSA